MRGLTEPGLTEPAHQGSKVGHSHLSNKLEVFLPKEGERRLFQLGGEMLPGLPRPWLCKRLCSWFYGF